MSAYWYSFLGVTIVGILIGALLVWLARRTIGGVLLGLAVFFLGLHFLMPPLNILFGADLRTTFTLVLIFAAANGGCAVSFAIVYPRIVLGRSHLVGLVLVGLVTFLRIVLVVSESPNLVEGGVLTDRFWALQNIGAFFDLAVVLILGQRWLTSPAGERRTQIAWGMLPFMFMALHDGFGFNLFPAFIGPRHGLEWLFSDPLVTATRIGWTIVIGGILALAGIALSRVIRGSPAPDERALSFLVLYMLPVTLIQIFEPGFGTGGVPFYHIFIDYFLVFLVVYAVARYNIVDLDLKLKWTMSRGTVAGVFVATFFIASEIAKLFFENLAGNALVGILAAGALVFAIAPLQRLADRLADTAMPRVQGSPAYLEEQRSRIYQAQVESLVADGHLSLKERHALLRLQADLALDAGLANQIETQVLADRMAVQEKAPEAGSGSGPAT